MKKTLFPMLHRLHFFVGLLVAPFIFVAAFTGMFYAIAPSLENIVYHQQIYNNSTGEIKPLSQQILVAKTVYPDLKLDSIKVFADSKTNTRVLFDDPKLDASYTRVVFVNPKTLDIKGKLTQYGSSAALPLRSWIDEGHRRLWSGNIGRWYSELAASWLGILAISGLYLWLKNKQPLARINKQAQGKRRQISWHAVTGFYLLPILLFLSVTGLTWSHYAGDNINQIRSHFSWQTPTPNTISTSSEVSRVKPKVLLKPLSAQADIAVHIAETRISYPMLLTPNENGVWTATETREPWRMSNNAVSVDTYNNKIVDYLPFANFPVAAKLTAWGIQLHMGILFGMANQLILFFSAIGLMFLIIKGYQIWWIKRPHKGFSYAALPGAWRKTNPLGLWGLIIIFLIFAWLAPIFAVTICGFLIIDGLYNLARRLRSQ